MKKGIKGSLFVILYVLLSLITQFIVMTGAMTIGALGIIPGLNLGEESDVAALRESLSLWVGEYSAQIILVSNLLLLGALFLILYLRKIPLKNHLGNGKFTFRNAFASFVLLNGGGILVSLLLTLPFLAPFMEEHDALMESISMGNPILVFLSVSIIGPIAEEFLFRVMIYRELKTFLPVWLSIILSALLFGVWHGNIVQGTYAFLMGLFLAASYEKTNSFWVPAFLHILLNSISFLPASFAENVSPLQALLTAIIFSGWGWKLLRKKEA